MNEAQYLYNRVTKIVEHVKYREDRNYRFKVSEDEKRGDAIYIQLQHYRPDTYTGEMGLGSSGKAYISPRATVSEILQTMLGLAKSYEEHEVREDFLVDGKRIFGPHLDWKALHEIADRTDARNGQ